MAIYDGIKKDTRLTNLAVSFNDPAAEWKKAFPNTLNVGSTHSWYPVFDPNALADIDDRDNFVSGPKTTPKEVGFSYHDVNVTIKGYEMFASCASDELREASAIGLNDIVEDITKGIVKKLNSFVDFDMLDLLVDTSQWYNSAVSYAWTNLTSGDPEKDLRQLRQDIISQMRSAGSPNTIIAPTKVLDYLFMHTKIKDRYDHITGTQSEKQRFFLDLLEIDNIIEIKKGYNTAQKENSPPVFSPYMGSYLWMGYIDPNPSRSTLTAMAALVPADEIGNDVGVRIRKLQKDTFDDGFDGIKIFGNQSTSVKQISKDCGKLLTGIYT